MSSEDQGGEKPSQNQLPDHAPIAPPPAPHQERAAGYFAGAKAGGQLPGPEQCQNAFFAHFLAAIANVVCCGFVLPIGAPLLVLLFSKQKTAFELFHIHQSVIFQGALFVIQVALQIWIMVLSIAGVSLASLLNVLHVLPVLIAVVYAIIVGMAARRGEWSEYFFIGEKVLKMKPFIS
ncbi:MAG: DUF4870 domain-containing protein [Myxococcales bacterium]|nr:MAG: DUF4870 domain-containing protein [Myxococcales bacterium]